MSNISTIYDTLITKMNTEFSDFARIPNPYDIESNPILAKKLWGLRVKDASTEDNEICRFYMDRGMTITLIRKFVTLESDQDGFDATSKLLLEDQETVTEFLLNPNELNIPDNIDRIVVNNVSGIQSMTNNDDSYLFVEIDFNVLVRENYS